MADYDYAPVAAPDDEEDPQKRLYNEMYPPVAAPAPPPSTPVPSAGYPAPQPVSAAPQASPAPVNDMPAPAPAGAAPAPESRPDFSGLGSPVTSQPPVQPPNWKDYAPAEKHGWGKFGSVMASLNPLSDRIVNQRPLANAERNYEAATNEFKEKEGQKKEASTEDVQSATAEKEREQADFLKRGGVKPGVTPEEQFMNDALHGEKGGPKKDANGQPFNYLSAHGAWKQTEQDARPDKTPNDFEQYYHDFLTENKFPDTAHNRLLARERFAAAGQAPQHDQRQLAVGPDGTVIELKPGVKVPSGTKSLGGAEKGPTADEQRRADLASNMNENLDQLEDILTRRPDLFGPVAGRLTGLRETVGTSDPDVAALKTLEEQVGMAMVGAHAMRNAGHVETAARSITNSFHNSPDAVKQAIATARASLATFLKDAGEKPGSEGKGGAAGGETKGETQRFTENGVNYNIPHDKLDAFKKAHPNAKVAQ